MALGLQRLVLQTTVLVSLVLARGFSLTGKGTSCGIVWEDSDMKLTCFFPENINEHKKDFAVYLYKGGPSPTTVVRCMRPPENGYYCKQNAGYEYDNVIHPSHVDIRIRNATREHFGVYECQIPGYSNTGTCSPPEKPRFSRCSALAAELTKGATVTCFFPVNFSRSTTEFTVYHGEVKVAYCGWIQGNVDCLFKPGYDKGKVDSNTFTVRIPQFRQTHSGSYSCDLSGYPREECSLIQLQGDTTACSFTTECHTYAIKLVCNFKNHPEEFRVARREPTPTDIVIYTENKTSHTVDSRYSYTLRPLTVSIMNASKEDTGTYCCETLGENWENSKCTLTDKEIDALGQCGARPTSIPNSKAGFSRCSALAELPKGSTVTCFFPVDVTRSTTEFTVHHGEVTVAYCGWIQGSVDCFFKPGYDKGKVDSNTLTVRIPQFRQNHSGHYLCDQSGYPREECSLIPLQGEAFENG